MQQGYEGQLRCRDQGLYITLRLWRIPKIRHFFILILTLNEGAEAMMG
jgi:hypothetical protein